MKKLLLLALPLLTFQGLLPNITAEEVIELQNDFETFKKNNVEFQDWNFVYNNTLKKLFVEKNFTLDDGTKINVTYDIEEQVYETKNCQTKTLSRKYAPRPYCNPFEGGIEGLEWTYSKRTTVENLNSIPAEYSFPNEGLFSDYHYGIELASGWKKRADDYYPDFLDKKMLEIQEKYGLFNILKKIFKTDLTDRKNRLESEKNWKKIGKKLFKK